MFRYFRPLSKKVALEAKLQALKVQLSNTRDTNKIASLLNKICDIEDKLKGL